MKRLALVAILSTIPMAAVAQPSTAVNRLQVISLSGTAFEVIEDHGEGARGLWCAAAEYAEDQLSARTADQIYLKSPRGPSASGAGRVGAVFTLNDAELSEAAFKSYSVSVRNAGQTLPVGHAIQFCKDYILELKDF
ncbi:MAG: hypothetical protein KBT76_02825 [Sulfitobacter litoralis]|uniref:Uncharacterized protein n=1 Tax=Sulfitobacter litoralis TaxID=335975 RepID=A0ABY0S2H7_9RHOB|nr:hypothetical protein [Sulfitobacter litoralis]MBQ0716777.1 hypothetical protein [Sulfitobacter litoralis]MBQ0800656.1 hypothetical protein [Sulfitobacter litoralis]SDO73405.1 hypothetical protein SAMN04488512_10552 [Sulfitobacter litoralis]|tara:strand:- start:741 stop:1151 length:411 start_codon:yes stop_codon:yes gene_type:complete